MVKNSTRPSRPGRGANNSLGGPSRQLMFAEFCGGDWLIYICGSVARRSKNRLRQIWCKSFFQEVGVHTIAVTCVALVLKDGGVSWPCKLTYVRVSWTRCLVG